MSSMASTISRTQRLVLHSARLHLTMAGTRTGWGISPSRPRYHSTSRTALVPSQQVGSHAKGGRARIRVGSVSAIRIHLYVLVGGLHLPVVRLTASQVPILHPFMSHPSCPAHPGASGAICDPQRRRVES